MQSGPSGSDDGDVGEQVLFVVFRFVLLLGVDAAQTGDVSNELFKERPQEPWLVHGFVIEADRQEAVKSIEDGHHVETE